MNTVEHGGIGHEAEGFINVPLTDKIVIRLVAYAATRAISITSGHAHVPDLRHLSPTPRWCVTFNFSDVAGGRSDGDQSTTTGRSRCRSSCSGPTAMACSPTMQLGDLKAAVLPDFAHDRWYQAGLTAQGKISNPMRRPCRRLAWTATSTRHRITDYSFFYDTPHGYGIYTYDNHGTLVSRSSTSSKGPLEINQNCACPRRRTAGSAGWAACSSSARRMTSFRIHDCRSGGQARLGVGRFRFRDIRELFTNEQREDNVSPRSGRCLTT